MKEKTAFLVNGLDPIFLNDDIKQQLFIPFLEGVPLAKFVLDNFPPVQLIPLNLKKVGRKAIIGFDQLIFSTNLANKLKKKGVNHFVVLHRNSRKLEDWACRHNFKLIGLSLNLQRKLENKVYFDSLLKKHKISSPETIGINQAYQYQNLVVQKQNSYGLFGTNFYKKLPKKVRLTVQKRTTFLVRKYLSGMSLGVSIIIDKQGSYFFSALRRQCFQYDKRGFPRNFLGIQWLPTKIFKKKLLFNLTRELGKLTEVLLAKQFCGIANIDFLIHRQNTYILECNPRLSSATAQIFSIPGLTSVENPWQFYLNSFTENENPKIKLSQIPLSEFSGALLDIGNIEQARINHILPVGVYNLAGNKINFTSGLVNDFLREQKSLFLFHELSSLGIIGKDDAICTVISHLPLFNFQKGSLNRKGLKVYNHFKKQFLKSKDGKKQNNK